MAEYFITKRDVCATCLGHGTVRTPNVPSPIGECPDCRGVGNIDTPVDLLEVLAKVRWSNSALDFGSPNKLGDNLHIEEGE